jgi:glucosamine-6-phosphate deaminase
MISKFDALELRSSPDRAAMGAAAAARVAEILRTACRERGEARVVFACAPSQDDFLAALLREDVEWGKIVVFHMDEYVGLGAEHPQSFRSYLREHLLAHITPRSVHLIAGERESQAVCAEYAGALSEKPLDLVCMGIGENGHLAFNDPPVADFADPLLVKQVELDEACRQQQVNDGCFPTLADVPTHALTLTIPALLGAAAISCVVPGERKAAAVRATLLGPVGVQCPASILRRHPNAVLHVDPPAISLLS